MKKFSYLSPPSFLIAFLAILLSLMSLGASTALAQSGALKGRIMEGTEPAIAADVALFKVEGTSESFISGSVTGDDGTYRFDNLSPGKYKLKITYSEFNEEVDNINISPGKTLPLQDISIGGSTEVTTVEIIAKPVESDQTDHSRSVSNEDLKKIGGRDVTDIVATMSTAYQKDNGAGVNIGGGRSDQTQTYIDGMRTIGIGNSTKIPQASVGTVNVITRGVPPQYGDLTSGVIEITTKDPAGTTQVGAEAVTSQFMDGYGYNLGALNITGPILKSKRDTTGKTPQYTKIGYLLAAEAEFQKDPSPAYGGNTVLRDGLLQELQQNPLQPDPNGEGFVNSSNFVTSKDFVNQKAKPNNSTYQVSFNGRLDFRLNSSTFVKVGGTARIYDGNLWSLRRSMFAPESNESRRSQDYRGFVRLTQYFTPKDGANSIIKNFFYNLQFDYTRSQYTRGDSRLQDDVFGYGHVGKFDTKRAETYELIQPTDARHNSDFSSNAYWQTAGYTDTDLYFDGSGSKNPLLANYNTYIFQQMANRPRPFSLFPDIPFTFKPGVRSTTDLFQLGGLLNGFNTTGSNPSLNIYSLWDAQGTNWGAFVKSQTDMFRVTGQATMVLGRKAQKVEANSGEEDEEGEYKRKTDRGTHTLKFGFEFDQRFERFYSIDAPTLWNVMRSNTNNHLNNLDPNSATAQKDENGFFTGRVHLDPLYTPGQQSQFDKNLRTKLGLDTTNTTFLNTDSYDPSFYSLKMFTANELLNNGNSLVNYYGYDYTGQIAGAKSGEEFFNNPNTRPQNAYAPTYVAGYIQDKFELENIFFSLGLRVDRFDGNQKVLKDKFVLGNTYVAGDQPVTDILEKTGGSLPGNVGTNWVPYVNSRNNATSILGYRDGSFWYDANGSPVDPTLLQVNGRVIPFMKTKTDSLNVDAFTDYTPQVNFMPRVSFSFPISDLANFFAHYDVLTQRPTTANIAQYSDYYYLIQNATNAIENPNLKPTRTIDYEVGFQQSLNEKGTLAIVISAYYRDMKDMIQIIRNRNAYPITYDSYENVDFGTVKGFTFEFITGRISNFQFRTSYTLQFAQGTGSSFSSSRNVLQGVQGFGLVRTLLPLSFDQRHTITGNIDFRFQDKNLGPQMFGVYPLKNFGISATFNIGSGTPYTRNAFPNQASVQFGVNENIQTAGTAYGSRLPFAYRVDLRVDKTFELKFGKKPKAGEDGIVPSDNRKGMSINIYALFLNVFNVQNTFGVYAYSGLPDDSGYLTSPLGPQLINSQINKQAFVDQYRVREKNPDNFSLPVRIRLGLMLNF